MSATIESVLLNVRDEHYAVHGRLPSQRPPPPSRWRMPGSQRRRYDPSPRDAGRGKAAAAEDDGAGDHDHVVYLN